MWRIDRLTSAEKKQLTEICLLADVDPAIAGKAVAEWISSNKARQKARKAAWQAWSEHAQKKDHA
jgi:hypothetical protein